MSRPVVAILPWGEVIEDFLASIGLTLDDFLEEMSGGWLFGYLESLDRAGVGGTIICTSISVDRPVRRIHRPTGAPVWLLPAGRTQSRLRRLARTGSRGPVLRKLSRQVTPWLASPVRPLADALRAEGVTRILCQEYSEARFTACLLVGKALRIPVYATFQGGTTPPTLLERATRPPSMRAAGFIVGSRPEADRIRGRYGLRPDRVHVIPNPVPLSEWPVGDQADARRQLGLSETAFVAAWHGRVELRRKGIDLLLDAWSRLERSGPASERTLLMVGTGPDAAEVHSTVDRRDDVAWTDAYELDRSRIRLHLAAADVGILPSRHEGFPVALLEMMASGRPVVTADVPGVGDIAPRGEQDGCVIVPVDDAPALSLAIRDLATADERRHRLGLAGRQRVGTEFSFETVGRLLAAAFDSPGPAC